MNHLIIKTSQDLASTIYQDSLQIRKEVFVKEQAVPPELETDADENHCLYYVLYLNQKPVATARVLPEKQGWHLQRVAVSKEYRKRGLARQLLQKIEADAQKQGQGYLTLGAQDQAQGFYLKLGYQVLGVGFLDAGITHHQMRKIL
ncbi:GNAT family N-acetyltransferase [Lactobacillus sp. DCY120]|uniref:GNAT family N-acetyltransferase n=1 Tax=Bombilactobacillus apium TaxID=2675299 RepID=A0A850RD62_9LACO|nr:GNAT family N-acetyltransferase [Bombilactobacillus apium]NVY96698.1 GNAT family N-acetyltransferase [Bombilactobacillus apium]